MRRYLAFGPKIARIVELDRLLAENDVVSLHCPLTPDTRGLMGRRQFTLMKPSACQRRPAARRWTTTPWWKCCGTAGSPAPGSTPSPTSRRGADHPLWSTANVVVSPHIAGATEEARREVSPVTVRNVPALLRSEPVHPRYLARKQAPSRNESLGPEFSAQQPRDPCDGHRSINGDAP